MRSNDLLFLVLVAACAAVFVALSIAEAGKSIHAIGASGQPAVGSAGRPRDVDTELLEKLIRSGYLSDHEAEFYKKGPARGEVSSSQ